jgi:hypothetical protein
MKADECHGLTRKMYRKLADCTGWERKLRSDQQFAESICQKVKEITEKEFHSASLRVWKPDGEVWKPREKDGLQLLYQLIEDLKAERDKTSGSLSDHTQDLTSTNQQCGTTALLLPSSAESAGQSSATPQGEEMGLVCTVKNGSMTVHVDLTRQFQ